MNSIKCKNCGLSNFPSEAECRRCGHSFVQSSSGKREDKPPRSFSIWPLIMLAVALGAGYYVYTTHFGTQSSLGKMEINEAKSSEPTAAPGLSKSQHDRKRSGHYGDAVRNSSSLKAHEQRTKETEKTVQQISNSR